MSSSSKPPHSIRSLLATPAAYNRPTSGDSYDSRPRAPLPNVFGNVPTSFRFNDGPIAASRTVFRLRLRGVAGGLQRARDEPFGDRRAYECPGLFGAHHGGLVDDPELAARLPRFAFLRDFDEVLGKRVGGDASVLLQDARGGRARREAPYGKASSFYHLADRLEHVGLAGPRVSLHADNAVLGR